MPASCADGRLVSVPPCSPRLFSDFSGVDQAPHVLLGASQKSRSRPRGRPSFSQM